MATIPANGSQSQYNQNVTFIGNGLPQGNPSNTLHLTSSATKINENAVLNRPNNMVSGNSRNTIHGIKNNALQGGKPENAAAARDNQTGGFNGIFGGFNLICDNPNQQYSILSVFGNSGCGCYVNTGIDIFVLLSAGKVATGFLKKLGIAASNKNRLNLELNQMRSAARRLQDSYRALRDTGKADSLVEATAKSIYLATGKKPTRKEVIDKMKQASKKIDNSVNRTDGVTPRLIQKEDDKQFRLFMGLGSTVLLACAIAGLGTLWRDKMCFGANTTLNYDTCECECNDGTDDNCETQGIAGNIFNTAAWVWDNVVDVGVQANEFKSCSPPCTCLQTRESGLFVSCVCDCDPPELPYGNGPCHYARNFDSDTCCCECPKNSDVYLGKTCGTYARLDDNLGTVAPSTGHVSYSTGCDCVCDGREASSSNMISPWPPECPAGKVWNGDPHTCDCIVAGTACFTGKVLYSTHSSGIGDPSFTGCDPGLDAAVVDAGEEYESTECWCAGEPDPSEGVFCGQFNPAFNIDCRTDMDEATANSLVGSRQVYNGMVSWYTGLTWYPDVQDCTLCS